MKNITFLLILLIGGIFSISCTPNDPYFATVQGQYIGKPKGKTIQLFKTEQGSKTKVAETHLGNDGYFAFKYAIEEPGIYVVNVIWEAADKPMNQDHSLKRFYLEKGTVVDIKLKDGSYTLVGSNSEKNKLLSQWNNEIDSMYTYSHGSVYNKLDYTSFFPLLPEFMEKAEHFKKNIISSDTSFTALLNLMVDVDVNLSALKMLYMPRSRHPKKEDMPEFYTTVLETGIPTSERMLDLPSGADYINVFVVHSMLADRDKKVTDRRMAALEYIHHPLLKGQYALSQLKSFKTYDENYLNYKQQVELYLTTDYYKKEVEDFEITIRKFETGTPAFDFSGKDINGKTVRLSDFKGNLVYVDVWATWCGPCKAQIPRLKELEKKYHNKPITFLSISLDKPKDQQKWVDFVKEKELKGVQLIAEKAFESSVAKAYGITAIPRFMLFDQEGKVISIDAPRPTSDNIETLLKKHL